MEDSKFLRALNLQPNSIPPVWFMRQAGRYLPEYQKIRKNYSNFLDMCKQPKTCAELAMQPIERFDLDASILFSDILTIPDALNLGLAFYEGEGPKFSNPISSPDDIKKVASFPCSILPKLSSIPKILAVLKVNAFIASSYSNPYDTAVPAVNGRFLEPIASISPA